MKLRCAIYARYSSDRQNPRSIDDQIRRCREYAKANAWSVVESHIYTDEAISGTKKDRPGYERLLKAVGAHPKNEKHAFDAILVEDTSRLWRDQEEQARALKLLKFVGIRLLGCDGTDSASLSSTLFLGLKGLMNQEYVAELAGRTRRGLQGAARERLHTGGRCFGYKNVQIGKNLSNGKRNPTKLVVDPEQAATVVRIFSMFAAGLSLKKIAKQLNADGVISPQPRTGREQSWSPSSIRVILHNPRYNGVVVFGKTRRILNPLTDNQVKRPSPEGSQIIEEVPEQRIIPAKLWQAVQEQLAYKRRIFGERGRRGGLKNLSAACSPYIFSGLLRCGVCGSHLMIVSGSGKHHNSADYGCARHDQRGTCTNARRVKRDVLETELLAKLQRVLSDAAIEYVLGKLEEEIQKRFSALDGEMDEMQRRKAELERKLRNLTRVIEDGEDSPSIRAAIVDRERELSSITSKTLGHSKGSVRQQIIGLRKFVCESVGDVRTLLTGKHGNPAQLKQELARHIDSITLLPDGEKTITYRGNWKVLGAGGTTRLEPSAPSPRC